MRRSPLKSRLGFTMTEVLTVMVIVALLAATSLPRLVKLRDQAEMSRAMTRFTRAVFATRQAAIQRGKQAYFKHNNNKIWVLVDTLGTLTDSIIVTSPYDLKAEFNVEVYAPAGLTTIPYDPRGVATQASKQVFKFKHRNGGVDSLCISRLGNTIREKCP